MMDLSNILEFQQLWIYALGFVNEVVDVNYSWNITAKVKRTSSDTSKDIAANFTNLTLTDASAFLKEDTTFENSISLSMAQNDDIYSVKTIDLTKVPDSLKLVKIDYDNKTAIFIDDFIQTNNYTLTDLNYNSPYAFTGNLINYTFDQCKGMISGLESNIIINPFNTNVSGTTLTCDGEKLITLSYDVKN